MDCSNGVICSTDQYWLWIQSKKHIERSGYYHWRAHPRLQERQWEPWMPDKDMSNLESGDEVAVDSSSNLVLELDGDKYVMLEPGTKITLEAEGTKTDSKTTIHLQAGAVVNHLTEKLNDKSSYEVTVPNSTMAVRGTVFRVEVTYDENGDSFATVSVFQGVVASRLIFPDGTIEELDKEKQIPMGKEVIVHGDTDISEHLWGDTRRTT